MSEETTTKQKKITFWAIILVLCVAAGVLLGIIFFESRQVLQITQDMLEQRNEYQNLQAQYDALVIQNEQLTEQVQVLSDTINKHGMESEVAAQAETEARIPTGFPVTIG